jgi:hypothetical protein
MADSVSINGPTNIVHQSIATEPPATFIACNDRAKALQ